MGLFKGIGKALSGINWDRVNMGLQTAGAISQGDYGTAAQIQGMYGRRREEQQEAQAKQKQAEAMVQALVRNGVPEPDARAAVMAGAGDNLLANRLGQQGNEYTYFDDNAGNRWRQNARTGQVDPSPTFIDQNPRTYFDPSQNRVVTVPNTYATQVQPQEPPEFLDHIPPGARPIGGGASNGIGNFPGFQRIPGGQIRFP